MRDVQLNCLIKLKGRLYQRLIEYPVSDEYRLDLASNYTLAYSDQPIIDLTIVIQCLYKINYEKY